MGKKTQAIYKALLARPVYSFLTEIQVTCLTRNPISIPNTDFKLTKSY